MFGQYNVPLTIAEDELSISVIRDNKNLIYNRTSPDGEIEKVILSENERLILNPIEPLNIPKELTSNLLIEFEKEVIIGPEAKRKIYLKFPIEIGVFLSLNKKNCEIIDIATLSKMKYTLYGSVAKGMICKYWKSDIYTIIPSTNPVYEGVMELNIENKTTYWVNVTKAIFNAYFMKIYYNDNMVSMKGHMEIIAPHIAETSIINSPIKKDMNKSIEYYTTRKIPVVMTKFVMEAGI